PKPISRRSSDIWSEESGLAADGSCSLETVTLLDGPLPPFPRGRSKPAKSRMSKMVKPTKAMRNGQRIRTFLPSIGVGASKFFSIFLKRTKHQQPALEAHLFRYPMLSRAMVSGSG